MKLILDTHVFLWFMQGSAQLGGPALDAILDPENALSLSAASYWEMCLKLSIGKLTLAPGWEATFEREMHRNEIRWLPISRAHIHGIIALPWHHRDPFDRMIIAQAVVEGAAVVTHDTSFGDYSVPVVGRSGEGSSR